ncbi:MAG: FAD-dependent oxidoreductase [Hyphomicrobiales bacterium]|nr:FAD-dependent oxidoreductase [Hyphomicrobiales bacterium]
MSTELNLAHGFDFLDLYDEAALPRLDSCFLDALKKADPELHGRLLTAREDPGLVQGKDESDLLLDLAPHAETFMVDLFGVADEVRALADDQAKLVPLWEVKRLFVQRRAVKAHKAEDAAQFDGAALRAQLAEKFGGTFDQFAYANNVAAWLEDADANAEALDLAERYAAWAVNSPEGQALHQDDHVFQVPGKTDYDELVETETIDLDGVKALRLPHDNHYPRDGFHLTDHGCETITAMDEIRYCVFCHDRGRDACSRGLADRKAGGFQKNPLGITLEGCPLEEKISEMHVARNDGLILAPLAIITVDNPTCAATGHRICNDCMKSCIYQKQTPVNIPEVETRILKDVLNLPWGFEIYSLLTRWNPLNIRKPYAPTDSGYKVLVVGLGPAGFSLAHFLMNEGHTVVGIDGLKIEPLPPEVCGVAADGTRVPFKPVHFIDDIFEDLDERPQAGFGGVAEYGITVRWNKNFLLAVRLLIERRARFTMLGGVRFGSAITAESAFDMGFDHVALCMGAGKPTFLNIPNGLARGVRMASDFLMALQLTGAAKKDSVANLQVRLPAVVIGGGLTAIDTATEVLAYYVRHVEKYATRYEALAAAGREDALRATMTPEEQGVADEYLAHGRAVKAERAAAAAEGRDVNFVPLLDSWGGSTIAYRRRMTGSPSYTLNHEEVEKALEQGIRFAELLAPHEIKVDQHGHVEAIVLEHQEIGEDGRPHPAGTFDTLPARSVLIAAGTQPNTVLTREHPGFTELDGKYFQARDEDGNPVKPAWSAKPETPYVLTNLRDDGRGMSFFGDLHPSWAGNVVKAVASAKQGYPVIDRLLARHAPTPVKGADLSAQLNAGLRATVHEVLRLTPTIIEVILHAPLAAKNFKPGQFFRLQNYEANAVRVNGTTLGMEGIALTGAWVDVEKGLVSTIVLEMGGSSNLCALLKPGEPVVLMGPTGAPTETPSGETVMLCGGGLGNAVLFSIGQALRAAGSKVLYFAGYKTMQDRYHVDNIEKASDEIVWTCDEGPGFEPGREGDKTFVGNIVQCMVAFAEGKLGPQKIQLSEVDRIIAIGSDRMMEAVAQARHGVLKPFLKDEHVGIGSINSPMQCMMKEICAQCLQPHKDPETGKETVVFSCFNQDQPLDRVVFPALRERLCQNAVPEKLTRQWIAQCMDNLPAGVNRI